MQVVKFQKDDAIHRQQVIKSLEAMVASDRREGVVPSFQLADTIKNPEAIAVYVKCRSVLNRCESPIEQRLIFSLSFELFLKVEPQIRLANYRADFGFPGRKIAVECDGHEYHKTQEQRTHDARRDRVFTTEGWNVIRFTGSEINADPLKCAREIERIYRAAV